MSIMLSCFIRGVLTTPECVVVQWWPDVSQVTSHHFSGLSTATTGPTPVSFAVDA